MIQIHCKSTSNSTENEMFYFHVGNGNNGVRPLKNVLEEKNPQRTKQFERNALPVAESQVLRFT